MKLHVGGRSCWTRHWSREAAKRAAPPCLLEVHGQGRVAGGGRKGRRRRWRRSGCSCAPDAAPWHCRGSADQALKTEAQGLITQVMSPCKLVSVTAVHRHAVVDIHALVVNPLLKQQQHTTTHNTQQHTTTHNTQQQQ